jgi:hypothetical protein
MKKAKHNLSALFTATMTAAFLATSCQGMNASSVNHFITPFGLNWSLGYRSKFKINNEVLGQTTTQDTFKSAPRFSLGFHFQRALVNLSLDAKNKKNNSQSFNVTSYTTLFNIPTQLMGGVLLHKEQILMTQSKQLETSSFFAGAGAQMFGSTYLNVIGSLNDWSINDDQKGRAPTFNAVLQHQFPAHWGLLNAQFTVSGLVLTGGARYNTGHKTQGFGASLTASQNIRGFFLNTSLSTKNEKIDGYHLKDQAVAISLSNHPLSNTQSAIHLVTLN